MLRQDDPNQIVGSTKIQRRDSILKILDNAVSVDELAASAQSASKSKKAKTISSLLSGKYFLVEGKRIGSSYNGRSCGADENATSVLSDNDLGHYLQEIRTKGADDPPRSSIYFPENAAGPDLVFALEPAAIRDSLNKRILCVVQLKTGEIQDIHHAIRTTDICTSYLGETAIKSCEDQNKYLKEHSLYDKRQSLLDEVRQWHKEGRRIIRILITTEQDRIQSKTRSQIADFKAFVAQNLQLKLNDYFILVSKRDADTFFGTTFCAMLKELKEKGERKGTRAISARAKSASSGFNQDEDCNDGDVEMPDA